MTETTAIMRARRTRRLPVAAGLTCLGILTGVGPAHAETAPATETGDVQLAGPEMVRMFYGWPILALGGTAGLLSAATVALPDKPVDTFAATFGFILGAPTYALAGPVVHWDHGHFGKGLVSFAANALMPVVGMGVGAALDCPLAKENPCGDSGLQWGAAAGFVVAPILDALILGWEDVPADYIGGAPARSAAWAPVLQLRPGSGVVMGVRGTL